MSDVYVKPNVGNKLKRKHKKKKKFVGEEANVAKCEGIELGLMRQTDLTELKPGNAKPSKSIDKKGFIVAFKRQAGRLIFFDENGVELYTRTDSPYWERRGWREIVRSLTYNGLEQINTIRNLSLGLPMVIAGKEVVPSLDQVMAANKFLLEFTLGKAVTQAEVIQAEADSTAMDALEALSDEELKMRLLESLAAERRAAPAQVQIPEEVDGAVI